MSRTAIARALAVLSVALTGWSLNVRWGAGDNVRGGPPMQWERHVVGAALLAAVAAVLVFLASRAGAHRVLRAAAVVLALGPGAIALVLRRDAAASNLPNLVAGPGWTWLAAGAGLSLLAAALTFAVTAPAAAASRKTPARRRAGGR